MRRFYLFGFFFLLAFDTLAQLSFKYAGMQATPMEWNSAWLMRVFSQPWIYGALVGYLGAFFTWMTLLKYAPIGPAFAASHLEIITVIAFSAWLFDEHIRLPQLVGALLIVAGVVCLALDEDKEQVAQLPPSVSP